MCGGRGPCCHVGYPHRHCEHCDVVVATHVCHYAQWPYQTTFGPFYGMNGTYSGLQSQLIGSLEAQFNHVDYPDK
jgi:hypothetical protein